MVSQEGETNINSGDIVFFPTGKGGAHKLINDAEDFVYIDFDTYMPLDITYDPGKYKIGIFGENYSRYYGIQGKLAYVEMDNGTN